MLRGAHKFDGSRVAVVALLGWLVVGCGGRQDGSGETAGVSAADGGAADDGGPAQVGAASDAAEEGSRGAAELTDALVESSANTLPDASKDATSRDAVAGGAADAALVRDGSFLSPTALVPNAYSARAIGVDDVNVYFSALSTGAASDDGVYQVPKNAVGSMPIELSSNDRQVVTLVSDGAYVYWNDTLPPEAIRRVVVGGNGATTLATDNTLSIALNPTTLFWLSTNGVQAMPKAGGTPTTLSAATGNSISIAIDASYIYFSSSGSTLSATSINRIPQAGGAVTTLATLPTTAGTNVNFLTTDGTNVYFVAGDALSAVPVAGGAVSVIAGGFTGAMSLKVDSGNLYASISRGNGPNGTVVRVPVTGGSMTVLASAQWIPFEIALDATSIYWTDFDITGTNGAVMVASK